MLSGAVGPVLGMRLCYVANGISIAVMALIPYTES